MISSSNAPNLTILGMIVMNLIRLYSPLPVASSPRSETAHIPLSPSPFFLLTSSFAKVAQTGKRLRLLEA